MPQLRLERKIAAPAEHVWSFVSWTGYERLSGSRAFTEVACDGDEVGATRILLPADSSDPSSENLFPDAIRKLLNAYRQSAPLRERLVTRDGSQFSYTYEPLEFGNLPLKAYRGDIKVTPVDALSCVLSYTCDYLPLDPGEDNWPEFYNLAQNAIVNVIQEKAEAKIY